MITDINNSAGVLSHKTCVAMHPYTSNVEEELKQIEKEQQEELKKSYTPFEEEDDE